MKHGKKYIVLHLTPHLGGGVGHVLLNYLAKVKKNANYEHRVISLEYANDRARIASQAMGFFLVDRMSENHQALLDAISQADIVLVHWWNHPLLYAFLVRESLPPSRIIFWSHVSGLHAPYVFNQPLLCYPDIFVFTSPISKTVPEVKKISDERQKALRVIWSTGGVDQMTSVRPKAHHGFNIGYVGTVDYGKLHPHFLKMSSQVRIPDAHFIVCGGPNEKQIQEESNKYDKNERFVFMGQISDVKHYLSEFDVFGYPLAPYHYGTCEQVLGESMAAGVPPVVLANPTEALIVENDVTGIVVADEDAYAQAIEELYHNPHLRQRLSNNAQKAAGEMYSLNLMIDLWEQVLTETLLLPKTPRQWAGSNRGMSVSAAHVFLESLGDYGCEFKNSLSAQNNQEKKATMDDIRRLYESSNLWKARTRGTANHYHFFFPDDEYLKLWADLSNIG